MRDYATTCTGPHCKRKNREIPPEVKGKSVLIQYHYRVLCPECYAEHQAFFANPANRKPSKR